MAGVKRGRHIDSDVHTLPKDLDEVSCPICMDHPHNAVLLLCSSHDKGCKSYICDTSYRHSNCLDRFKKLKDHSTCDANLPHPFPISSVSSTNASDTNLTLRTNTIGANENNNLTGNSSATFARIAEGRVVSGIQDPTRQFRVQREVVDEAVDSGSFHGRIEPEGENGENLSELGPSLRCPLCRGAVLGWKVVEDVRKYLNLKKRSCSRESCSFSGNYQELRRHARRVHPTTRPSEIDPSREREWRYLEHQREYGDIVSAIRSAMPGAVVVGDYVIENGDRFPVERENGTGEGSSPWWTTFFLFQMIGSMDRVAEPRSRSRGWTRHRRSGGAFHERRLLWGENLLGLQHNDDDEDDDDNDLHIISDAGEDVSPIPRRRRRLTRSRSNDRS